MSAGTPLSGKIELPAAFQEALGEYKKALSSVKAELREVDKLAKEMMRERGYIDSATQKRQGILRDVAGKMQDQVDEQTALKEQAHKQKQDEKKAHLVYDLAARAGFKVSMPFRVAGGIESIAKKPDEWAKLATNLGMINTAKALTEVGKVTTGIGDVVTAIIRKSPYVAAGALAAEVGVKVYENWVQRTDSDLARSSAIAQGADALKRLGGPDAGARVGFYGAAQKAQRVFADQQNAMEIGRNSTPVGFWDALKDPWGVLNQGAAVNWEYAKELGEHSARMEEARQRYGLTYQPDVSGTENIARYRFGAKYDPMRNTTGAMTYAAKWLYYAVSGEADEFASREWDREKRAAELKQTKDVDTFRKTKEFMWNVGIDGAERRVLENEKRRWLRAVEVDRLARFNAWGMV